jgi:hypothetical protein
MFSDMTFGAKIFWCIFCLTYVAGFAFVRFIDKAIAESGRDTTSWPHWATLVTIWLCSPVAPQQRKAKQRKILIFNENQDFLFSQKTQKSAVHDRLWWSRRWSKRVFQTSPP